MDKAGHWKHLLQKLNCIQNDQITNPPGFQLTLEFVDSLSQYNYRGAQDPPTVTLTIDGIFVEIDAGTTQTYIGLDQLLSVTLTAV